MKYSTLFLILFMMGTPFLSFSQHRQDTIATNKGNLIITFLGHGTLYFTYEGKVIHIDPFDRCADYSALPKADLIFVTHHHGDHFQPKTLDLLRKDNTILFFTETCAKDYPGEGRVVKNGETFTINDIPVEVVPAYNLVHERSEGNPFHPKGQGNGYVFTFGDKRVYIAGDTENFPEMKDIQDIDIAFLPMNLPYTMTPAMVVEAVKVFKPRVLYPYHFGDTDVNELLELMQDINYCEVRVREMR